jgi:hypothetical protein
MCALDTAHVLDASRAPCAGIGDVSSTLEQTAQLPNFSRFALVRQKMLPQLSPPILDITTEQKFNICLAPP